jgi:hypothetical protein
MMKLVIHQISMEIFEGFHLIYIYFLVMQEVGFQDW